MGGLAALAYVTRHPTAALVLLAPVVPQQFAGEAIEVPCDPEVLWLPPPGMAASLFWNRVSAALDERYTALLSPESPLAVIEATRWTVGVDTSTVTAPSLLSAAEDDPLVPAPYVQSMAAALGSEFYAFPGEGHGLTLNPVWEAVVERVIDWLRRVRETPRLRVGRAHTSVARREPYSRDRTVKSDALNIPAGSSQS